jgi:SPP1 gp7 family putative phage head morphogenesis protein
VGPQESGPEAAVPVRHRHEDRRAGPGRRPAGSARQGRRPKRPWPAWGRDLTTASLWEQRITTALDDDVDSDDLAEAWLAHHAHSTTGHGNDWAALAALAFLRHRNVTLTGLLPVLRLIWLEGWAIGHTAARALLTDEDAAWAWAEGDTEAALGSLPGDVADAARTWASQSAAWAQKVLSGRLDALAKVLADALRAGGDAAGLSGLIRRFLGDGAWARMLALSELVRAQSAAAIAAYRAAGVVEVRWVAEGDERTCLRCEGLAAQGPVPVGQGWDGADGPPAHPNCRCFIAPA